MGEIEVTNGFGLGNSWVLSTSLWVNRSLPVDSYKQSPVAVAANEEILLVSVIVAMIISFRCQCHCFTTPYGKFL